MMETSENLNKMPLNPEWNQKQDRTFEHPRRKTPWLLVISFVFLAAAVAGFIWHDLTLSYKGSVNHWKVLLTNSANDNVGLADMWLREREMNAEYVAANPLTSGLLVDASHNRNDAGKRRTLEQDLKRTASANGFLGGLVLDLQCRIVANSDAQVAKGIELETICKNVYRTKSYHVLASGLDRGDVRLTAAVPVFAESTLWPSGKKIHSIVGIVAMVANPWKTLLPFFVPEGEPAKSLETSLIWKREDHVVIFFPARAARGEKAVIVRPLKDVSYEGRVAVGSVLAFGEFKDFRGVRVFGVAKQIPLSGDHLARTIDRDEALADFHRQVALESFAGILVLVLFGFLAAAVYRHTATKELLEKLKQQEALLALKKDVEISEERYRDIFEHANDAILIMGFDSRIISMNKSAEHVSGYSRDEAQGESLLRFIAPEYHERILQTIQTLLEGGNVPLLEVVLTTKDGRRVFVEANRQLIYKDGQPAGIQVIARDITDRKRTEQELQEEKAFTDAVVKSLPGAFFVIDRQGRLVRWNQGVESLGYSSQELAGVDADTLMAEEDRPLSKAKREQAFAEGRAMAEGRILTRDGLKIPYLFTAQRAVIGDHEYAIGTGIDITERKRMIEALRENEDRYRDLVEHSHALMSTHDLEGRLLSVNLEAARILGYSTEELLKIEMQDLLPPEFRGQFQDYLAKIRSEGAASGLMVVQTRTGERRIWEYSNTLRTEGVAQPVVRGVAIDITERKRAEEALRQSESRFRGLVATSPMPMLVTTTPPEERILLMNRRFTELFGYTLTEVKDVQDWWPRAYPDPARRKEVQKAWDERVAAASAAGREAIEPSEVEITCLDGSRRQVEVHMNIIGDGTLVIFNDLTDRKKAQLALLESEERFRRLSDASFEGIAFTEAGKLIDTNSKLAEMLGYDQRELIGMDLSRLVAPESMEEVMAHIRSQSESLYENLILRKDGTIFPVETKARYLPWKGKRVRVTAIRDITERKKAEEALRESEERFRQMAVHSPYAFFLWDVYKQEHAYVSPAYETIWGLTPESLYVDVDGWKKAVHPDDRERMERRVLGDFQSHPEKEGIEDEFRIIRPDGSTRWVQMHRFPVRNESKEVYRIGLIAQDVTERKHAELALIASEASLAEAQRIGQMGSWEYNALTDSAMWSDELFHLYGLTSDQKEVTSETFLKLIHPDDREAFVRASEKAQKEEKTFYAEFRIIRADSAVRFLQARAEVIRDSSGKTLGMIGTNQDVTERKQAELALKHEKAFSEAVIDSLPGAFYVIDQRSEVIRWNKSTERILGYSREELEQVETFDVIAQEDRAIMASKWKEAFAEGSAMAEAHVLTKDGRKIPFLLTATRAVLGENTYVVGMGIDITERKLAEEALRESEERFRQMADHSPYMFWLFDVKTEKLLYVSPAFEKIWKRKVEDLYADPRIWRESLCPDDRDRVIADFDTRARAQGAESDYRILLPDGSLRWLHGRSFPLRDASGEVHRLAGIVYDVTERKQADLALEASEASLAEAQRIGQMGSWEWNAHTKEEVWSDQLFRLYGLTPGERSPTEATFFSLLHPEDKEALLQAIESASKDEETLRVSFRIIRPDGELRYFQSRVEVVRDSAGNSLRMIGTNQDVTERVRADEALRQREKELEEAQRLAKVGSWAMDIQTRAVTLSEELYRILGLDLKGPAPTLETIAQCYSPETWAQFQAAARRTLETGEPFVVEGALNLADGTKKWVLSRGELQRDANGNPACYRGTTQDITERKEAEEALRSSQEMFFKAFHSSPEPVSIMTLGEGRFIDVNKAFSDQLGYTRAEVIGHTVDELGLQPLAGLTTEESQLWEQGALRDLEVELFTKFGEVRTALVSFEAVEIGGVTCILAQGRDITEHRRAEKALRASDERYRAFISHSQDGVWRVELDQPISVDLPVDEALERLFQYGWFAECNDAMARINGATRAEEIIGKRIREFIPPSEIQTIESLRSAIRGRWQNRSIELQRQDKSGIIRTLQRTEVPIIENGRVVRIWGISRDVTELKQAEDALRKSEASLAEAQRIALAGSWDWDIQSNKERWSDGMFLLLGMPPGKFEPTLDTFMSYVHPDDREGLVREGERAQKEKDGLQYEYRAIRADGAVRIFQSRAEIVRDAAGNPVRMLGATQDVTERKRAEEELKISEARYKTLIEGAPEAIVAVDPDAGIFVDFNENAMHLFGLSKEELLKVGPVEVSPPDQPDGRSSSEAAHDYLTRAMAGEDPVFEWTHRSAYGKDIPCEIRLVRLPAAGRNLVRGSITDITERKQAEEERSRLVSIVESSGDPIVGASIDGFITDWNAAAERVYGYTAEEIHGKHITILAPPSGASEIPVVLERINQGERTSDFEAVSVRKDGTEFPVSITMSAIRNSQGEILGLSGIIRDIASRKRLEEQVTLSQKMESVGRLAGGVAHDFNNMLQIIHGYSELVLDELAEEDPTRGHVQEIKNVVERAAGLTRQLLAFGRQQVLSPQVMDLNVAITHLSKMLRRLIGEDINLEIREAKDLGRVRADPGQIDQVIMNLAVNARDAMPTGGKLSIETANVQVDSTFASGHFPMTPGKYVMISVSDTGIGMDAATQARIFEPFFTTKEKGKGTGLGLATVYGIVKQSGGYIWVQSELGRGSAFRVYLPPVKEAATTKEVKQVRAMKGGTETVLLVEDEENVRLLVRRALQAKGYTVLEAQNGKDALRVAHQHQGPIHLLMTDVVMPGMGGRELAERLIRLRGELKTLYMSGYADDAIHHHGVLNPGTELLQKPFSADVLAAKVREVLKRA
jgi:PAS domain S-box-containing protein